MTSQDRPPLVDTHAHIFRRDMPLVARSHFVPARDHLAEDYLAMLDASGIRHGVIAAHSAFGTYSSYTVETLRLHPRLRGTVIVDPDIGTGALRDMDAAGVVGIRLRWQGNAGPDITDVRYRRLFKKVRDLDWQVHVFVDGAVLPSLVPTLKDSGVTLVLDHFGNADAGPDGTGNGMHSPGFNAALRMLGSGHTWVKLAAPYRLKGVDSGALAQKLLAEGGPERLLWGTDWPWLGFQDQHTTGDLIDQFRLWIPSASARETMDRNALTLYRFPA